MTAHRLTADVRRLIVALARKFGISHAAVIEIAVRRLAEVERVDDPEPDTTEREGEQP